MIVDCRPVPGLQIDQQPERVLHRLLLFGEARGEQDSGGTLEATAMLAVAWVPMNRTLRHRPATTLKEEILRRWAFSCFNPNDPNRPLLLHAPSLDAVSWERADTVVDLLEARLTLDPSRGATHYCAVRLWGREPVSPARPQWFERPEIEAGRTRELARWGHHVFAVAP